MKLVFLNLLSHYTTDFETILKEEEIAMGLPWREKSKLLSL